MPDQIGVKLRCSCGLMHPIEWLYWCRHCVSLKCSLCVSQEVDSYFCPVCLDDSTLPNSLDAAVDKEMSPTDQHLHKIKQARGRHKCSTGCMNCPVCPATLTYVAAEGEEEGHLVCGYCQWHSDEIALRGDKAAILKSVLDHSTGSKDEKQAQIMVFEEERSKEERQMKDRARQSKTREALYRKGRGMFSTGMFSKYPASRTLRVTDMLKKSDMASRAKALENLRDRQFKVYNPIDQQWVEQTGGRKFVASKVAGSVCAQETDAKLEAALALTGVEGVATMDQRLGDLTSEVERTATLWPSRTTLVAKRSKRCRECQHNLIKPDLSPTSTKFKMQLFARSFIPIMRVTSVPELKVGEMAQVVLTLANPLDQELEITIEAFTEPVAADEEPSSADDAAETKEGEAETETEGGGGGGGKAKEGEDGGAEGGAEGGADDEKKPLAALSSIITTRNQLVGNAEIQAPGEAIKLAEYDPVQDYSSASADKKSKYTDNPAIIKKRHGNTVEFFLPVTPREAGPVRMALSLSYKYSANVPGVPRSIGSRKATTPEKKIHTVMLPTFSVLGVAA